MLARMGLTRPSSVAFVTLDGRLKGGYDDGASGNIVMSWPALRDQPLHISTAISTRRFFCRPSGLSLPSSSVFGAMGRDLP
jgi:hypothetical protein